MNIIAIESILSCYDPENKITHNPQLSHEHVYKYVDMYNKGNANIC